MLDAARNDFGERGDVVGAFNFFNMENTIGRLLWQTILKNDHAPHGVLAADIRNVITLDAAENVHEFLRRRFARQNAHVANMGQIINAVSELRGGLKVLRLGRGGHFLFRILDDRGRFAFKKFDQAHDVLVINVFVCRANTNARAFADMKIKTWTLLVWFAIRERKNAPQNFQRGLERRGLDERPKGRQIFVL